MKNLNKKKGFCIAGIVAILVLSLVSVSLPMVQAADPEYSLNGSEVLVEGSPIRGSNGIFFDSNDLKNSYFYKVNA